MMSDLYAPLERFLGHPITQEVRDNINTRQKEDMFLYNYNERHIIPRDHPVLVSCRGLILNSVGKVLAYPLDRFFNLYEPECKPINWIKSVILEKVDGSLIIVFWHNEKWNNTTRGAFYPISNAKVNFDQLFRKYFHDYDKLDKNYCYMFELCTAKNRIITWYNEPQIVLVAARNLTSLREVGQKTLDSWALKLSGVRRPKRFSLSDPARARELFSTLKDDDEGFVIVDHMSRRVKLKQDSYLKMVKIKMLKEDDILDYVRGITELDAELLYKDVDILDMLQEVGTKWNRLKFMIEKTYENFKDLPTRKEFALQAVQYPYRAFLFTMLDGKSQTNIKLKYETVNIWLGDKKRMII